MVVVYLPQMSREVICVVLTYISTAEASNASASPTASPSQHRSGRNRHALVCYGEWVCQQSAENPDLVEHFV